MSQVHGSRRPEQSRTSVVSRVDEAVAVPDLDRTASWVRRRVVLLAGLVLVAVQVGWRVQFLSGMYYRQDDFYNFDIALKSPFNWRYLTSAGADHLMIAPRTIIWIMARLWLYSWTPAFLLILAVGIAASLAALRMLRTIFGERPAILIPLAIYVLCPLTLPASGWWMAAIETLPLQLAIFMAVNAHVSYVRSGELWHVAVTAIWVGFGFIFSVKAIVLPVLLFGISSAFLVGRKTWAAGAGAALVRFWKAWVPYGLLVIAFAVVLGTGLRTSAGTLRPPNSVGSVLTFSWALIRLTFIPGAVGGPWRWTGPGTSYALALTPAVMSWMAIVIGLVVVVTSVLLWRPAWRSWALLAVWLVAADIAPVVAARFIFLPPVIFGEETRYVADAVPLLALCVGFAFLPMEAALSAATGVSRRVARLPQRSRLVVGVLAGVFVFGSIWSAQAYQANVSTSSEASYIATAQRAIRAAPRGTLVFDAAVPDYVLSGYFGKNANESRIIGAMERGDLVGKLKWVERPQGNLDNLMLFGPDGRLRVVTVYGAASLNRRLARDHGCWPAKHGQITVPFGGASPSYTSVLRIAYIGASDLSGFIAVRYGSFLAQLPVRPGLHAGYVQVTGSADKVIISGFAHDALCVGDVEAGYLGPAPGGPVIPPVAH